ncbi:MAG TPA: NUDIX domain-containing protein [Candidatus Saccharimonadales bacterium]|nr:NUDIX domain-containing protein [Candidatus Saccharimonadales bacterium]
MSVDKLLHKAHVAIIHVLLFKPDARFAQLQKASQLPSDHFNFYLKQLLDDGLVAKNKDGAYHLTFKGKEFANRFDTDARTVERQPKVAVCLMVNRGDGKWLVQQRLKQPFYGYWGRPTGKIRWGETILEAAARELMEETGLTADLQFDAVYHKQDFNQQTGEMLEDKIFFVVACTNPRGNLITEFEGGRNAWLTHQEYASQELSFESNNKDGFASRKASDIPRVTIVESRHSYAPEHY